MTSTLSFIVGMIVGVLFGGAVGLAVACICAAARDTDDSLPEHPAAGRAMDSLRKQGGYINLDGLFFSLATVGAVAGGIAVLAVVYGGPWAWDLVKPWLHEVTR